MYNLPKARAVPELILDRILNTGYPEFFKVLDIGYRISDRIPVIRNLKLDTGYPMIESDT